MKTPRVRRGVGRYVLVVPVVPVEPVELVVPVASVPVVPIMVPVVSVAVRVPVAVMSPDGIAIVLVVPVAAVAVFAMVDEVSVVELVSAVVLSCLLQAKPNSVTAATVKIPMVFLILLIPPGGLGSDRDALPKQGVSYCRTAD